MKEAFVLFKAAVWAAESRAALEKESSQKALIASAGNGGGGGIGTKKEDDYLHTISELKACLLERDNEIAILVNMVKQGKTPEDIANASGGGTSRESIGKRSGPRSGPDPAAAAGARTTSDQVAAERQRRDNDEKRRRERQKEKEERILKVRLFSVIPPSKQVLQDPALSFDWFQERSLLRPSIEDNMAILREAIQEAKTAGEKANKSRNAINYLKSSVEAIRRER